jgi:hypothetical protein
MICRNQEGRTKYGFDVQAVDCLRKYKYVNLRLVAWRKLEPKNMG